MRASRQHLTQSDRLSHIGIKSHIYICDLRLGLRLFQKGDTMKGDCQSEDGKRRLSQHVGYCTPTYVGYNYQIPWQLQASLGVSNMPLSMPENQI